MDLLVLDDLAKPVPLPTTEERRAEGKDEEAGHTANNGQRGNNGGAPPEVDTRARLLAAWDNEAGALLVEAEQAAARPLKHADSDEDASARR
jgi:hypothetical protein